MKKQSIFIVIGLIAALAVLFLVAGNGGGNSPASVSGPLTNAGGKLVAAEAEYDFGTVSINRGKVVHDFVLTNASSEALTVEEVSTSCMCTEAFLKVGNNEAGPFGMPGHGSAKKANFLVQPGEQLTVKVEYDPAAHGPTGVGRVSRDIYLRVAENEQVVLKITATVIP